MTGLQRIYTTAGMLLFLTACNGPDSTAEIPAVDNFSLERYLGTWHEAARLSHSFEKGMSRVTAEYFMLPDGTVRVRNRGVRNGTEKTIMGYVRQKQKETGELEVSFFRPFYGAYRIIALKEDYSAALVTSSSKKYAWILVRDPAYAMQIIPEYSALLKQKGFDCSKLEFPSMKK